MDKTRYRYKTWWWGRYIVKTKKGWISESGQSYPSTQAEVADNVNWQIYQEEIHGKHLEQK